MIGNPARPGARHKDERKRLWTGLVGQGVMSLMTHLPLLSTIVVYTYWSSPDIYDILLLGIGKNIINYNIIS